MKVLPVVSNHVSAAAIYPYSEELLKAGARVSRFGDPYHLFRVVGVGKARRIWVPRNMAPPGSVREYSDGLNAWFKSSFVPRNDEQARIVDEAVDLLMDGQSFIVEAGTGTGKTVMAMDMIAQVKKKTIVIVTKEDIKHQWVDAAKKFLNLTDKEIGVIQADRFEVTGKKLVIAMIQSLAKEDRYPVSAMREFGLCIVDEVHRVGCDFFCQSCFRVPARLRLGLSATPVRKDGREEVVAAHIGPILVSSTLANMAPRVIVKESPWHIPLTRVKDQNGQFKVGPIPHSPGKCGHIINLLAGHHGRNELMANFIGQAYKKGRVIMVQSDRKNHLETLNLMSQHYGVPPGDMGLYVGGMSKKQLEVAKTKKVIFSTYSMTAEATDIPQLDTLVMATPKSDIRQIVGRILRVHEGKKEPVVFDVVDSSSNVFKGYWDKRMSWYRKVGAEVIRTN